MQDHRSWNLTEQVRKWSRIHEKAQMQTLECETWDAEETRHRWQRHLWESMLEDDYTQESTPWDSP